MSSFHINSVLRENLDNKAPFDLMDSKDGKKLLSLLQLSPIPPDEVTLSPKLLFHLNGGYLKTT